MLLFSRAHQELPISYELVRSGLLGKTRYPITLDPTHHYKGERECGFIRVVGWNPPGGFTATVRQPVPEEVDQDAILPLLTRAREDIRKTQPINLNFPAGFGVEVLNEAGFCAYQTLIWMEYQFQN